MSRLTGLNAYGELVVNEEEWLIGTKGYIDKDEMYKIMRHLAEKLKTYEDLEDEMKDEKQIIKDFIDRLAEELYSIHSDDNPWCEYSADIFIDEMVDVAEKLMK